MNAIILEAPEIPARQLREIIISEREKKGIWGGWKDLIDRYRENGMEDYADKLIQLLELDEFLDK